MELIDIIKSTISIFSAIVFGSIGISYAIYKIKNHSRTKPQTKPDTDNSLYGKILNSKDLELSMSMEKANSKGNISKIGNYSMQHKFNLVNVNNKLSKTDNSGSITLNSKNKNSFKNKE
jgi:hypothetical protein